MEQYKAHEATIRLFNSVVIDGGDSLPEEQYESFLGLDYNMDYDAVVQAIGNGIALDSRILDRYRNKALRHIVKTSIDLWGVSNLELNSTFYESASMVRNYSELELFLNQLSHYMFSYIKNSDVKYDNSVNSTGNVLKVIHAITVEELNDKIVKLLMSNMSLDSYGVALIHELMKFYGIKFNIEDLSKIQNKEVMCEFFYMEDIVPDDSVEFLRYIIYLITTNTMLIKNDELYDDIKFEIRRKNNYDFITGSEKFTRHNKAIKEFLSYDNIELAKIFNRFKPIFMVLKEEPSLKTKINQISRLSKKHHEPYKEPVLTSLTYNNYTDEIVSIASKKASTKQLIRSINAINEKINLNYEDSILKLYKIRNGKTFIKESSKIDDKDIKRIRRYSVILLDELMSRLKPSFKDKVLLVNSDVDYVIPTSFKDLIGESIPNFTTVNVEFEDDEELLIGIVWDKDADIDLSARIVGGETVSWDRLTRSESGEVVHTGDMVKLNNYGLASEFIVINSNNDKNISISDIMYYNRINSDFAYKFVVAKRKIIEKYDSDNLNKIANIGDVLFVSEIKPSNQSKMLGVYDSEKEKFIVTNLSYGSYNKTSLGNITNYDLSESFMETIRHKGNNQLTLQKILSMLIHHYGLKDITLLSSEEVFNEFIKKVPDKCIDLRPESINKNTFIDLLDL